MDKLQELRDASERAHPGEWAASEIRYRRDGLDWRNITAGPHKALMATAVSLDFRPGDAEFIPLAVNFTRSILDGSFLDDEAVERGVDALIFAEQIRWNAFERDALRAIVRAILTASLTSAHKESTNAG